MRRVVGFILKPLTAPNLKGRIWKHWYRYFERKIGDQPLRFMNYGLSPSGGPRLELEPADEPERLSIQLYHRVVSPISLSGARVLEVSCGRGGGTDYAARYLRAGSVVGLDRTETALAFCRRTYSAPNLSFICGDALALPLDENSVDVVVNVEASHCYPDLPRFLCEVRRVLRPGGHFLYADFRRAAGLDTWIGQLAACGLSKTDEEDMTRGVVAALASSDAAKASLIRSVAPRLLRNTFNQFAGTKNSIIYRAFDNGNARYMRFVFQK